MGNCFANGSKGLVHPVVQPFDQEGTAWRGSSQVKVRMTVREFRELVARAESRKCGRGGADVGMLIMEGVRQGRWEAVPVCDAEGGGGGNSGNARVLETINED